MAWVLGRFWLLGYPIAARPFLASLCRSAALCGAGMKRAGVINPGPEPLRLYAGGAALGTRFQLRLDDIAQAAYLLKRPVDYRAIEVVRKAKARPLSFCRLCGSCLGPCRGFSCFVVCRGEGFSALARPSE